MITDTSQTSFHRSHLGPNIRDASKKSGHAQWHDRENAKAHACSQLKCAPANGASPIVVAVPPLAPSVFVPPTAHPIIEPPTLQSVQAENEELKRKLAKAHEDIQKKAQASSNLLHRLSKREEDINQLQEQPQQPVDQSTPKHLDPMFNTLFRAMKKELQDKDKKIEELQQEVLGTSFTPYSIPGKKLLAKLRALQDENEELGRQLCQGKVEQLQVELALQKRAAEGLRASLDESNRLVVTLDSESETLQSQIFKLQARLKQQQQAPDSNLIMGDHEDPSPKQDNSCNSSDGVGGSGEGENVTASGGTEEGG
ncbi:hypothetical protein HK097_000219 [Rhizophlyctis rosea]|uniref:Pre-mRNA-splicing regulator WTAP n=1 Tax=Rhizophlyctis rosea TaxID=64517 RepID=A0AAD5S8F0_9FUNG|nr:hypothetical protein HK097_000219 [Rhizophlyctis rosea]